MLLLSLWWRQEMLNGKSKCLSETVALSDCFSCFLLVPSCEALLSERSAEGQCFCFSLSVFGIYFQKLLSFFLSAPPLSVSPPPLWRISCCDFTAYQFVKLSKTFWSLMLKGQRWKKVWDTKMLILWLLHDFSCIINNVNCSVYMLIPAFDVHTFSTLHM